MVKEVISGRFETLRLLGEGGDSRVYLVQDTFDPGRRFALKKLSRSPARFALEEFRRLCSLNHPAIPRAHEVGIDPRDGAAYFTSEFVEGQDFLGGLRQRPLELQLEAIADLLRTLEFLHRQGVIHRDLKPANVLIRRADSALRVHLIDFGLAREVREEGELSGSIPYLAPELFSGHAAHASSDLYALGVMLYELWFGKHPFQATSPLEWVRAHQNDEVLLPEVQDVPTSLGRLVQRLLAKDPDSRYPRAAAVLADLSRISVRPLPAETRRSLLGRVRSLPKPAPESKTQDAWERELSQPGSAVLWIVSSSESSRTELLRDLKATSLSHQRAPLLVPMGAGRPLDALGQQVRVLQGALDGETSTDPESLENLSDLDCAVFLENFQHRLQEQDYWLRMLIRQPLPLVIASDGPPEDDALGRELVQGNREVVVIDEGRITRSQLQEEFPNWIGIDFSDELAGFLGIDDAVESHRLIESLTYLIDCRGLEIHHGEPRLNLAVARQAGAPDDVVSIVRARLALLAPAERDFLGALAVFEEPMSLPELEAVLEERWDSTLDRSRLVDAALVRATLAEGGERLQIGRGGVRDAALAGLDPDWVVELHARVARLLLEVLKCEPEDPRVAQHQWLGAPSPDSAASAAEAADRMIQESRFQDAMNLLDSLLESDLATSVAARIQFLRGQVFLKIGSTDAALDALEAAANTPGSDQRRSILTELARAQERAGRFDVALATLQEAANGSEADGALLAQRAFLLYRLGRLDEARECCHIADRELPPDPTMDRVRTHNTLGLIESLAGSLEPARRHFQLAVELSSEAGRPTWKASAQHNLGRLEDSCGQLQRAIKLFQDGQRLMDRYGDRQMATQYANTLAITLFNAGQLEEAKSELQRSREDLEVHRLGHHLRRNIANLQAQIAMAEGELEVALTEAQRAAELGREQGDVRGRMLAEVVKHEALCRLGDAARVRAHVREMRVLVDPDSGPEARESLQIIEALAAAWTGDAAEDAVILESADPDPEPLTRRVAVGVARARLLLTRGEHSAAIAEAEALRTRLVSTEMTGYRALVRAHELAARLLSGDQTARARDEDETLREIGRAHPVGHAGQRAEALYWVGASTGNRTLLFEALRIARKTRHAPLADRIQAALDQLGESEDDGLDMQSRKRLRLLERMEEVTKAISRESDGSQVLRRVLDHALELTGARRGFLILLKGDKLSFPAARNIEATDIENPEFSVSSSVARTVALEGTPYIASDVKADARFRHSSSISQLRLQSILCVPMHERDGVRGAIYLDDPTRVDQFDEDDLQAVKSLTEHASIALKKAELLQSNIDRQQALLRSKKEIERLNRQLALTVEAQAQELIEVKESLRATQAELSLKYEYPTIVTRSRRMREVLKLIDRITDSSYPVYLYGESGTGKELIARSIHRNGARSRGPFFSINCASMSPALIETELFGHVKGSFTGADRDKPGAFELADGGILFLDEISDASPELQSKLLRAIQFGEVLRVGSEDVRKVDVMVISASNRDLQKQVEEGSFREDLYYRVAVHRVEIPPLRDRREDVPLLLEHFLARYAEEHGVTRLRFQKGALRRLMDYSWPGNVRELQNCVIRLMVRFGDEGEVAEDRLPEELLAEPDPETVNYEDDDRGLKARIESFEKRVIAQALRTHDGNRARAARDLRMSERNLYKKLSKYGLDNRGGEPEEGGA